MDKTKEMTQEREAAILEGAINKWGNTLQITVAIEELSELQKALCKYQRWATTTKDGEGRAEVVASIKDEIADVSIMLNQLELIFGDCTEEEIAKLERLEKMVGLQPPSRWTPKDIEAAKALHALFPNIDLIHRKPNGDLEALDKYPEPIDHESLITLIPLNESLFDSLGLGKFVFLTDVIGGGEGGNGE